MSVLLNYSAGVRASRRAHGLSDDHRFLVPSAGPVRNGYSFHDLTDGADGTVLQLALSNGAIVTMNALSRNDADEALHRLARDLWEDCPVPAEDLLTVIDLKVLEIRDGQVAYRIFDNGPTSAELYIEHVELDSRIFQADGMAVDFQYLIDFYGEKFRAHRIPTFLELCREAYVDIIQSRAERLYPEGALRLAALSVLYPPAIREK